MKGIALLGAFSVLAGRGYEPQNVAGASPGPQAALIAVGYGAQELKEIVANPGQDRFKDETTES